MAALAPAPQDTDRAATRPPIAHVARYDDAKRGLCGSQLEDKPAPPAADKCCVCADLSGLRT